MSMTKFGTYPVIRMQSANLVKLKAAITRIMIQNAFYFMKDGHRKCTSVNMHCFENEHDNHLQMDKNKGQTVSNMSNSEIKHPQSVMIKFSLLLK